MHWKTPSSERAIPNAQVIVVEGFGHAETAISEETLAQIGQWLRDHVQPELPAAKG